MHLSLKIKYCFNDTMVKRPLILAITTDCEIPANSGVLHHDVQVMQACLVIRAKVRSIYWAKFAQGRIQTLPSWYTPWTP